MQAKEVISTMPTEVTFICDCGTRLSIMTDSDKSETTIVPCPREGCEGRHIVSGQVLEVFIVQGGRSFPYDWKHTTGYCK